MSRSLSSSNTSAVTAQVVRPVIFVELVYDNATTRVHSDTQSLSFEGKQFTGVGGLGGISAVQEQGELAVSGLELTLSGIDSALVAQALNEPYQGRPASVWVGYKGADNQLVDTPILIFKGRMDRQSISLGEKAEIRISVENRLVDWDRPRVLRYNHASQQSRFPADKGLMFVEQAAEKRIVWGQADKLK